MTAIPNILGAVRFAAVAGLLLPGLAACNFVNGHPEIVGSIPDDYRTRHPIVLEEGLATMDIPVAVAQGVLTDGVQGNIVGFGRNFKESGATSIAIMAPTGTPNQAAAAAAAGQIRRLLQGLGIPPTAIDMRLYQGGPREANAAVRIVYARVTARTTPCGTWSDQSAQTSENRNYKEFGCSSQQNLAVMVANPLDLMYPREMTPPDAERRGAVLKNYRSGDPTQSSSARDKGGAIAQGVGQ